MFLFLSFQDPTMSRLTHDPYTLTSRQQWEIREDDGAELMTPTTEFFPNVLVNLGAGSRKLAILPSCVFLSLQLCKS